jgi:hypothetical protein
MHCRALVVLTAVLLACSSDSSSDETTNANEDSTSGGGDTTTSTTGTDTTGAAETSTDEGVKYDIGTGGGTSYLLAVATPADPAAPLQFLADFVVADAALEITLQPLDAASRQPVGDPFVGDVMFTTPAFSADFAGITIPAAANAVGDADLQGTLTLIGSIAGAGTPCGMLDGSLDGLEPAALGGGTWAAVEVSGELPTDFPTACP